MIAAVHRKEGLMVFENRDERDDFLNHRGNWFYAETEYSSNLDEQTIKNIHQQVIDDAQDALWKLYDHN